MTDYTALARDMRALLEGERNWIANLSNASALLSERLDGLNWVGFYLAADGGLVLGPFQGKPACVRIAQGRGVCGAAARENRAVRVSNVHEFPGHIACDGASNAELVIPLRRGDAVIGVLDLDSPAYGRFTEADEAGLTEIVRIVEQACDWPD